MTASHAACLPPAASAKDYMAFCPSGLMGPSETGFSDLTLDTSYFTLPADAHTTYSATSLNTEVLVQRALAKAKGRLERALARVRLRLRPRAPVRRTGPPYPAPCRAARRSVFSVC